jgi:hypothetical protein
MVRLARDRHRGFGTDLGNENRSKGRVDDLEAEQLDVGLDQVA